MPRHIKLLIHILSIVLVGTVLALLFAPLYDKSVSIADLENKISDHKTALEKLERPQAKETQLPTELVVSGNLADQRLIMQQSLSSILRTTEARLDRMRQLPDLSSAEENAVEIRVQVQWSGDLQTQIETLRAIDSLRPMMFAEEFVLNAGPTNREDRIMRAEATFVRLWIGDGDTE